jgi:acyl carrier protein phosphodiesterase
MNFLGHLYFSQDDVQLQYVNLFGDFVKGRDLSRYSSFVQRGIKLHRTIDSYIDNHAEVRELMHQLYEKLPKISGIAIDLYFDHLLAKNWKEFHTLEYDSYLERFYNANVNYKDEFTTEFLILIERMKEYNWMHYYQFHDGLIKMCNGLSRRISFENKLSDAPIVFSENEELITEVFHNYMKDAKAYFKEYIASEFPEIS